MNRSLALSACLSAWAGTASALDPDSHYVAAAATFIKESLPDPYTIREAARTAPIPIHGSAWTAEVVVCARYNAKNLFGAYVGKQVYQVVFYPRQRIEILADNGAPCSKRDDWQPFPELGQPD